MKNLHSRQLDGICRFVTKDVIKSVLKAALIVHVIFSGFSVLAVFVPLFQSSDGLINWKSEEDPKLINGQPGAAFSEFLPKYYTSIIAVNLDSSATHYQAYCFLSETEKLHILNSIKNLKKEKRIIIYSNEYAEKFLPKSLTLQAAYYFYAKNIVYSVNMSFEKSEYRINIFESRLNNYLMLIEKK